MSKHRYAGPDAILFKERETVWRQTIPADTLVGIRLDGKAFHTFTRQFAKPYDLTFMDTMDKTGIYLLDRLFTSALFGYVQSDEITLFFTDKTSVEAELPFAGKVEKILTTAASTASIGFLRTLPEVTGDPIFDARIFTLNSNDELIAYLDWRRMDARKNSITMATEHVHGPKKIQGIPARERLALLDGTDYKTLPDGFFYGRMLSRETYTDQITWTHKKTGKTLEQDVTRTRWISTPAIRDTTQQVVTEALTRLIRD